MAMKSDSSHSEPQQSAPKLRTEPHLSLKIFYSEGYFAHYSFVVVDLALGEQYPENFYCVLSKQYNKCNNNRLFREFGKEKALKITKKLLLDAKRRFFDSEAILKEIEHRLKELEPKKPKPCLNCGALLGEHRRRFCKSCAEQRTKEYLAEYHRRHKE